MDSRPSFGCAQLRGSVPMGLLLALACCQPAAELDWLRPSLSAVEGVALRRGAGPHLRLELGLRGAPSWWSMDRDDRVRVGQDVLWLRDLVAGQFSVGQLSLGGARVIDLNWRTSSRRRLVLLLDRSAAVLQVSPGGEPLILAQRVVDAAHSGCAQGIGCMSQITVITMHEGQVEQSAPLSPTAAALALEQPLGAGGRARLWDGAVAAAASLGAAPAGSDDDAVLIYWGSAEDGGSSATAQQARAALAGRTVVLVRGPGAGTAAEVLLDGDSAMVLPVAHAASVADLAPVVTAALGDRPVLTLAPAAGQVFDDLAEARGTVTLELDSGARWHRSFLLPVLDSSEVY